jgi:predicted metal-dependent hydrolase
MPAKLIELDGIGPVSLYKRRSARSIRISITHQGQIRVSLPFWAPYSAGIAFLESRKDWVLAERPQTRLLGQGYRLGKAHHISFMPGTGSSVTTRVAGNEARIMLPTGVRWDDPSAQEAAIAVGTRVLKKESRMLLPRRLELLAVQHGFTYKSVTIKQLTGRWGSCSEQKDIVLNCFLMQLPWELIDYVILHELVHTHVMTHGPVFWREMERVSPDVQRCRKLIKTHKPVL